MRLKLSILCLSILLMGCIEASFDADNTQADTLVAAAAGTPVGVASEGERIANELCGTCHFTPVRSPDTDIGPSWSAIAADPENTDPHIREFLATPHWPMRRNTLSPQQIEDVIAYIRTLEHFQD